MNNCTSMVICCNRCNQVENRCSSVPYYSFGDKCNEKKNTCGNEKKQRYMDPLIPALKNKILTKAELERQKHSVNK